jgi:hypothetical protein
VVGVVALGERQGVQETPPVVSQGLAELVVRTEEEEAEGVLQFVYLVPSFLMKTSVAMVGWERFA